MIKEQFKKMFPENALNMFENAKQKFLYSLDTRLLFSQIK